MKPRSDIFHIIQEFYGKIKNQFYTSIKMLRTDNTREYVSAQFQYFLTTQWVIHQSLFAYKTVLFN